MHEFAKWLRTVVRGQSDRIVAWSALVAGAILLLVGWLGVSRTAYPAEQIPYIISAGIGAMFLLGIGAVLWLSADLRDEWRKLDRIERAIESRTPAPGAWAPALEPRVAEPEPERTGRARRRR